MLRTATPDLTLTPGPLTEQPPTITPPPPTPTTPPTPLLVTIESQVTPPADAAITLTDISSDISADLRPVNPGRTFPAGIQRIYFFFEFGTMADGMSWSRVLLRNGEVVRSESEEWDRGPEGQAYHVFVAQGGWPGGSYEIRYYAGSRLLTTEVFSIIN
jgi:hypothetical protein